jgi:hypothetical protein
MTKPGSQGRAFLFLCCDDYVDAFPAWALHPTEANTPIGEDDSLAYGVSAPVEFFPGRVAATRRALAHGRSLACSNRSISFIAHHRRRPRPWLRRPKQAGFLGKRFRAILGRAYRAAAADLRIRTGKNRLTVSRTIRAGFSSKRYRKGTRLVQVQPVNGFGVVGTSAKTWVLETLATCPLSLESLAKNSSADPFGSRVGQHLDDAGSSIPGSRFWLMRSRDGSMRSVSRTDDAT